MTTMIKSQTIIDNAVNLNAELKSSNKKKWMITAFFIAGFTAVSLGSALLLSFRVSAQNQEPVEVEWPIASTTKAAIENELVKHQPLPEEVRGIYLTGMSFGSKRLDQLLAYAHKYNLNTMVIDVKLDNGGLIFEPHNEKIRPYVSDFYTVDDLDGLLEKLKDENIYRIARIFVMRDTVFGELNPTSTLQYKSGGIWRDRAGTPWLDPASPEVTQYAIDVALEAYERGFDEVQFDYVRFPTDGAIYSIKYPVWDEVTPQDEVMRNMYTKISAAMEREGIPYSYDFYGMTCWRSDDFGIGQRLADVYGSSTAISPMLYPSHFPDNFKGYANPANYPYETIKLSLDEAIKILKEDYPELDEEAARKWQRPWIQDFDIGAVYDSAKIHAQVKGAREAGASGFLIWNARNVYSELSKPL